MLARMRRAMALPGRLRRCDRGVAAVEFALIAPILMMLMFAVLVYSLYFAAYLGVRQAASEGARAAMAGLSTAERTQLATARATTVIQAYGSLLGASTTPTVTAGTAGTGLFKVSVSYNIGSSPIMAYGALLPLPSAILQSDVTVANGSY